MHWVLNSVSCVLLHATGLSAIVTTCVDCFCKIFSFGLFDKHFVYYLNKVGIFAIILIGFKRGVSAIAYFSDNIPERSGSDYFG